MGSEGVASREEVVDQLVRTIIGAAQDSGVGNKELPAECCVRILRKFCESRMQAVRARDELVSMMCVDRREPVSPMLVRVRRSVKQWCGSQATR